MKLTIIVASLLIVVSTSFAADAPPDGKGKGQDFDKRKSEIVNRINERIARNQEELACVQAATNHDALKACRDKFRGEMGMHMDKGPKKQ